MELDPVTTHAIEEAAHQALENIQTNLDKAIKSAADTVGQWTKKTLDGFGSQLTKIFLKEQQSLSPAPSQRQNRLQDVLMTLTEGLSATQSTQKITIS